MKSKTEQISEANIEGALNYLKEIVSYKEYEELFVSEDARLIPANKLKDIHGDPLSQKVLEALPAYLTLKEYKLFMGVKPYAKEEIELLGLKIGEWDYSNHYRILINTKMHELADENYYLQLESEAKGLGDLHRLDIAEGIVEGLKKVIGDKRGLILQEFEKYNQRKMQEYLEKKANEEKL